MSKPAVIIDFDGTLTRVRWGWDKKMKDFFLGKIFAEPANFNAAQKQKAIAKTDTWIEQAPGTTILQQMSALSEILVDNKIEHELDQIIEEFDRFSSDWEYARFKEFEAQDDLEQLILCGARKFLIDLVERGYALHLLSGTSHEKLIFECDTLNISQYFTHIQGYQSHLASPYKLESIRKTLSDYDCKPSETLIIGDGLTELEAGRKLHCPCIGVAISEEDGKTCEQEKLSKLQAKGFKEVITDFDLAMNFIPAATNTRD